MNKKPFRKLFHRLFRQPFNNNRGQFATDMFDAVMIVIFSVIFFAIVAFALAWNTNVANKQPIKNIAEYHFKDSALNNILASSSEQNFEGQDLNLLLKKSKILGGKVISTCNDYGQEDDCNDDAVGLFLSGSDCCVWSTDQKCRIGFRSYCREREYLQNQEQNQKQEQEQKQPGQPEVSNE